MCRGPAERHGERAAVRGGGAGRTGDARVASSTWLSERTADGSGGEAARAWRPRTCPGTRSNSTRGPRTDQRGAPFTAHAAFGAGSVGRPDKPTDWLPIDGMDDVFESALADGAAPSPPLARLLDRLNQRNGQPARARRGPRSMKPPGRQQAPGRARAAQVIVTTTPGAAARSSTTSRRHRSTPNRQTDWIRSYDRGRRASARRPHRPHW